jgi:hypothetical protein
VAPAPGTGTVAAAVVTGIASPGSRHRDRVTGIGGTVWLPGFGSLAWV